MSPFLTTLGGGSARGFGRAFRRSGPTTAATSLSATPASTSVQLSWTNTNAAAQIRVYRAATLVTTLSAASTTYTNTGLSSSTSYSYTVVYIENGIEGPASNTATTTTLAPSGQQAYTSPGNFAFIVPTGVTSISVVCIGGGTTGYGGHLSYYNGKTVTPGQTISVQVGYATDYSAISYCFDGTTVFAAAGNALNQDSRGQVTYQSYNTATAGYAGSGGAGGASGAGGPGGGSGYGYNQDAGYILTGGGGGGGVGILGIGSSGASGAGGNVVFFGGSIGGLGGGGGSGGSSGGDSGDYVPINGGYGGYYGGGGGAGGSSGYDDANPSQYGSAGSSIHGAVRIIWGTGRSYPSNAANV